MGAIKLPTISKTPQARCDFALAAETGPAVLDVMANDRGGKAKSLYSLAAQYDSNLLSPSVTAVSRLGAEVKIVNGKVVYNAETSATIRALDGGEFLVDSFVYAIRLANGTISTATVSILVEGADEEEPQAPVFGGGEPSEAVVTEPVQSGEALTASGTIRFQGEALSVEVVSTPPLPQHGTLVPVLGDGVVTWTYELPAGAADILSAGQTRDEYFLVQLIDGNGNPVQHTVMVTVQGSNDVPVFADLDAVVDVPAGASGTWTEIIAIPFSDRDSGDVYEVATVMGATGSVTWQGIEATTDSATGGVSGTLFFEYRVDAAAASAPGFEDGFSFVFRERQPGPGGAQIAEQTVNVSVHGDEVAVSLVGQGAPAPLGLFG